MHLSKRAYQRPRPTPMGYAQGIPHPLLMVMVLPWLPMEAKDQHLVLRAVMIRGRLCNKHQDHIRRTRNILAILAILQGCLLPR